MNFAKRLTAIVCTAGLYACAHQPIAEDPTYQKALISASDGDVESAISVRANALNISAASFTVWNTDGEPKTYTHGRVHRDFIFQAASISKTVSAACILILAQRQGVGLDEDISSQITSLTGQGLIPENRKVTLRQLLSHTAGTSIHGFAGYDSSEDLPTTAQIVIDPPGIFNNGVEFFGRTGTFQYSGGGFMLAQLWAEDVSGRNFSALAEELVFEPLAMRNSTFEIVRPQSIEEGVEVVPANGDGLIESWRHYPESAAAGLWTTTHDLAVFLDALLGAYEGDMSVISRKVATDMLTRQVKSEDGGGYGLGTQLMLDQNGEVEFITHSGANLGYRALYVVRAANEQSSRRIVTALTSSPNGVALNDDTVFALIAR